MSMRLPHRSRRRAAHLVECAIIFSLTIVLLAGLVVCATGVFCYQQTAYLARETARHAAVHAGLYQKENAAAITAGTLPDVNKSYLLTNVVQAKAINLDSANLATTVTFNTSSGA